MAQQTATTAKYGLRQLINAPIFLKPQIAPAFRNLKDFSAPSPSQHLSTPFTPLSVRWQRGNYQRHIRLAEIPILEPYEKDKKLGPKDVWPWIKDSTKSVVSAYTVYRATKGAKQTLNQIARDLYVKMNTAFARLDDEMKPAIRRGSQCRRTCQADGCFVRCSVARMRLHCGRW